MAQTLDLEATERQARALLDSRIESVRKLVTGRQKLAELREHVEEAERDDVRLYNAATAAGWTPDELRKLGIAEPEKKIRVRRRSPGRRSDAPARDAPVADSSEV